jgi:hypothetical protein
MICKKPECENEVTRDQMVYCSRACAPLSYMVAANQEGQGRPVTVKRAPVPPKKVGRPRKATCTQCGSVLSLAKLLECEV